MTSEEKAELNRRRAREGMARLREGRRQNVPVRISPDSYKLLKRLAKEMGLEPVRLVEVMTQMWAREVRLGR